MEVDNNFNMKPSLSPIKELPNDLKNEFQSDSSLWLNNTKLSLSPIKQELELSNDSTNGFQSDSSLWINNTKLSLSPIKQELELSNDSTNGFQSDSSLRVNNMKPSLSPIKQEAPNDSRNGFQSDSSLPINNSLGHFEVDEELKWKEQLELKKIKRKEYSIQKRIREQQEMIVKKERARKSMQYLLGKSLKFSNFFKDKLQEHMANSGGDDKKQQQRPLKTLQTNVLEPKLQDMLNDSLFKEELEKEHLPANGKIDIMDQLKFFEGGVLKPYQIEGLTWLTILFENGVNGILADEMGLGKTIQVIALICHLYEKQVEGPYLIVGPLSTVPNWASEFKRFAPQIPIVVHHGSKDERYDSQREILSQSYMLDGRKVKPVIITSYQIPLMEGYFLGKFRWQYIIIDEGHRLKNHQSKLSIELKRLKATNKLLLTGTPLQNNLIELWALLNFILPHIFTDMETFASLFLLEDMQDNNKIVKEEQSSNTISTIHKVLAPFMLRRLKSDVLLDLVPKKEVLVYCPMTQLQIDLYRYIIQRNLAKLVGQEEAENVDPYEPKRKRKCTWKLISYTEPKPEDVENLFMEDFLKKEEEAIGTKLDKSTVQYIYRITMQNTMIMFKKVVDHPYLIHFPLNPNSEKKELLVDEQLVQQSGKMLVLDAMLARLKRRGHKVLIFSTLVMLLDMIEDYILMRNYNYRRLDGGHKLSERDSNIRDFNTDPDVFVFLISTRAGGLGLNLTAADTVIMYDRDWNPQVDIQAQDRCHRIGQTKPVMVFSLVTKNTIDERIIKCGNMKRRLEKIVIKDGKFKSIRNDEKVKLETDFEDLQKLLESSDISHKIHSNGYVFTDEELDRLLDRSDLYREMEMIKQAKDLV